MRRAWVVVAFLAAGCSGPSASEPAPSATASMPSPSGSAALTNRRLAVPSVTPGAACPTTTREPWSGPGVATAVLGAGPVYPVADYFDSGTTLLLGRDDRELDGTYTKKVRWIGAGYIGPIFIRVRRIDGAGTGLVRLSDWGEQRDGGYYADLPTSTSDLPAVTALSGPGCYAYQVDGDTFTITIVFLALANDT